MVLAVACTNDPFEAGLKPATPSGKPKVVVDFSVQIEDPSVATRALGQKPTLRNLMVAVFDPSGYLLEYTYATEIDLATENYETTYTYKVAVTQSAEPRIVHFIGNAPDKLTFGVEEAVLASITSSVGDNEDDGIYWCRREIPLISGTNSGGSMALSDEDDPMAVASPIYQADALTRANFSNVGLIRNFAQIKLVSSTTDFILEKYFVVGTPKTGLAAAYNYNKGEFVDYYELETREETVKYEDSTSKEVWNEEKGEWETIYETVEKEYTTTVYELGDFYTYSEIIAQGYDANVLPSAERFVLADSVAPNNWVGDRASAYVFECEKPLKAEDAVYIIAYGKYKDGKNYYYKIDLRDKNGYFPILRNFRYTIDLTDVTRPGYTSVAAAAASAGSGDISTSLETKSLAYISDGVASLEVEYIEKYIVTPDDVTLDYTFLDNVSTSNPGAANKMWIVVNEAGVTGAAIAKINGSDYTVGEKIAVTANPGTLTITPTALGDAPKSQTLTIYAEYVNGDASHTLQRTVNYIVQSKRTMLVSLKPSEVPRESGSEFDVKISLPAGLSKSIFPLEFLIESEALSINPSNDQMPVRTGVTLKEGSSKSSFYFVKSLAYADYNAASGAENVVNCHFKTIKAEAQTHIFAANPYFVTEYDYKGTVSDLDNAASKSVYLDTYAAERFTMLQFSQEPIVGVGEDLPIRFDFSMSKVPEDGIVYVSLGNLQPAETEDNLEYVRLENGKAVYKFNATSTSGSIDLTTAHYDGDLSVDLSAYHFVPASKSVGRDLYQFNGSFNKPSLSGLAETVSYTFFVDKDSYYEGMVIEIEMKGLKFNENKLPADWDNWRDLGNGVYGVQYIPSGYLNSVTINLLPTITDTNEECSITLQAKGYQTQTSTIRAVQDITIPAGKLTLSITSSQQGSNFSSSGGNIYIYDSNGTQLGTFRFDNYQSSGNNTRTVTNNAAVTLTNVTSSTQIYVTYTRSNYSYKSSLFTIGDAVAGTTVTLTR